MIQNVWNVLSGALCQSRLSGEHDAVTVVTFWVFWGCDSCSLASFLLLEIRACGLSLGLWGILGDDICSDLYIALPSSLLCLSSAICVQKSEIEKGPWTMLLSLSSMVVGLLKALYPPPNLRWGYPLGPLRALYPRWKKYGEWRRSYGE